MKNRSIKPLLSDYLTKKRIQAVKPYIKGNVLDLGCGFTKIPPLLAPEQKYVGVDQNQKAISVMLSKYPHQDFYQRDLETDEINIPHRFNTILMLAILEHLNNPNKILGQIPRLLLPDGNLLITTPTLLGGMIHNLGSQIGLFYKEAMEDHKKFYTSRELAQQTHSIELDIVRSHIFLFGGNQLLVCQINPKN